MCTAYLAADACTVANDGGSYVYHGKHSMFDVLCQGRFLVSCLLPAGLLYVEYRGEIDYFACTVVHIVITPRSQASVHRYYMY